MRSGLHLLWSVLALSASGAALAQPAAGPVQPTPVGTLSAALAAPVPGLQRRSSRENATTSIQDLVRLGGHARVPLRGLGIATGLRGTGDAGSELALARPLAEIHRNNGNPLPELSNLAKAKAAALVSVTCEIPEGGGRTGDRYDVIVRVLHSASSLRGGYLEISPLSGPLKGQGVFGFASGKIELEDEESPTVGRIVGGGQLLTDISPATINDRFSLVIRPPYRSFATAQLIASEINGLTADLESDDHASGQIARALDQMTVEVIIPEHERANPNAFMANVLTKRFSPTLLDLPAQVIVNERTGSIVVTGDVEISAVTVGNDRLIVTAVTPPPTPTPLNPQVARTTMAEFGSTGSSADRARIQDLLEAFKQLNIPVREQIQLLSQINSTGRLHARFIAE